jgi:hypothetical protein
MKYGTEHWSYGERGHLQVGKGRLGIPHGFAMEIVELLLAYVSFDTRARVKIPMQSNQL